MAKHGEVADLFRFELARLRIRHGWSQQQLADEIGRRTGMPIFSTTISRIESGDRAVRIDELNACAEIFGVTADALLCRPAGAADVLWAAERLCSGASQAAADLKATERRMVGNLSDLCDRLASDPEKVNTAIVKRAGSAVAALTAAYEACDALANGFPLP